MEAFRWIDGMSVGVPDFDESHRGFCDGLAAIVRFIREGRFEAAAESCRDLEMLAAKHNREEEAFLRRNSYPFVGAVVAVQVKLGERMRDLSTLIEQRSPEASSFAETVADEMVTYLLRGDINFKSFVQELDRTKRSTAA